MRKGLSLASSRFAVSSDIAVLFFEGCGEPAVSCGVTDEVQIVGRGGGECGEQ